MQEWGEVDGGDCDAGVVKGEWARSRQSVRARDGTDDSVGKGGTGARRARHRSEASTGERGRGAGGPGSSPGCVGNGQRARWRSGRTVVEGDGDGVDEEQAGEVVRIGGVPGGVVWRRGVVERRRPPLDLDPDRERGGGRVGDGVDGVRVSPWWGVMEGRGGPAGPGGWPSWATAQRGGLLLCFSLVTVLYFRIFFYLFILLFLFSFTYVIFYSFTKSETHT